MKPDYVQKEKSKLIYYVLGAVFFTLVLIALVIGEITMLTDTYADNKFLVEEILIGLFALIAVLADIALIVCAVKRKVLLDVEQFGRKSYGTVIDRTISSFSNSETGETTYQYYIWYEYYTDNRIRKICQEKVTSAEYNIISAVCEAGNVQLPILQLGDRAIIDSKTISGI